MLNVVNKESRYGKKNSGGSSKRAHVISRKKSGSSSKRAHIISRKNGWAIKKEGASRASKIYQNIDAAIKSSEKLRQTGHDIIVHRKDGTIQDWKKSKSI